MTGLECAKCKSTKIIPKVPIMDRGHGNIWNFAALVQRNSDAMLFKGSTIGALYARICGECGHAELYMDNPEAFYAAYLEGNAKRED